MDTRAIWAAEVFATCLKVDEGRGADHRVGLKTWILTLTLPPSG